MLEAGGGAVIGIGARARDKEEEEKQGQLRGSKAEKLGIGNSAVRPQQQSLPRAYLNEK